MLWMRSRAARTLAAMPAYSPALSSSPLTRLEPMPTQETPAPNQLLSEASVASTPPVGMMETHGHGPLTDLTKEGPPTSLPGNTLTISQPSSSACEISDALPQPGE